jgi:membrane-associated phospholipid phosphatase
MTMLETSPRASSWLPRSRLDLFRQAAIWLSFVFAYQIVQAGAGQARGEALANGLRVADLERDLVHRLVELKVQDLARSSGVINSAVAFVYWCSELAVVALALLWVYLRRHEAYLALRNTLIVTNLIALPLFYAFPTAPPRAFASLGFVDTLKQSSSMGHGHGLLPLPSNAYAAMPSLHSADALIIGVALACLVRSRARALWLLWPVTVWFSVMATANHFWLDVVAGIVLAVIGALAAGALGLRSRRPIPEAAQARAGRFGSLPPQRRL